MGFLRSTGTLLPHKNATIQAGHSNDTLKNASFTARCVTHSYHTTHLQLGRVALLRLQSAFQSSPHVLLHLQLLLVVRLQRVEILRVARAVPGTDPDKYHHVSSGELQTLSPRLWQSVHGLLPDGKAHLYERLRQRKYRVAANSLHPLKETVATVQLFTLVANSEYLPFNFISCSNRCNNHPLQITYVNP